VPTYLIPLTCFNIILIFISLFLLYANENDSSLQSNVQFISFITKKKSQLFSLNIFPIFISETRKRRRNCKKGRESVHPGPDPSWYFYAPATVAHTAYLSLLLSWLRFCIVWSLPRARKISHKNVIDELVS